MASDPLALPKVGLGTWKSGSGEAGEAVRSALRLGYRLIDCAAAYGNEAEVGDALAAAFASGAARREDVVVVGKVYNNSHGVRAAAALERSLADLRVGVDLYLMHWPTAFRGEGVGYQIPQPSRGPHGLPNAQIETETEFLETWRHMEGFVHAGKVGAIGVCNFTVGQLEELLASCEVRPAVNQVEAHPFLVDAELHAFCRRENIKVMSYSPLGSGDSYAGKLAGPVLLNHPTVRAVAAKHGATPAQALLAWGCRDGACVLAKSVREERLAENLRAQELTLDAQSLEALTALDKGYRFGLGWAIGQFWTKAQWDAAAIRELDFNPQRLSVAETAAAAVGTAEGCDALVERLCEGSRRGAAWLRRNLPYVEGESYTSDLPGDGGPLHSGCFMVTALAYQKAGLPGEAALMAAHVADELAGEDGRGLLAAPTLQKGGFIPYAPAWHALTLSRLGRPDSAQLALRRVLPWQATGRLGGFFDGPRQRDAGRGVFCFDSSCAAILACLQCGALAEAARGGEYLLRLDTLSDSETRVWTLTEDGRGVYDKKDAAWQSHSCAPDTVTVRCTTSAADENAPHWKTGFYLAACAQCYRSLGDDRYLEAAKRCAAWAMRSADRAAGWTMFAHKLAWGAAALYAVTRNEEHLVLACECAEIIRRRQCTDGWFPYPEWFPGDGRPHGTAEPTSITYSIGAQGVIWMAAVRESLLLRKGELVHLRRK